MMKNIRRQSALALAEETLSQGKQGLGPGSAQGQGLGAGLTTRLSPRAAAAASADTTASATATNAAAAAAAVSVISASPDPLAIEGFVNIRVKPPLHTRGDQPINQHTPSHTPSQ